MFATAATADEKTTCKIKGDKIVCETDRSSRSAQGKTETWCFTLTNGKVVCH